MIGFFETEPQLSFNDIKEIENYVGLTFPDEYKIHLIKYNGGRCFPNVFKFIENDELAESNIEWFNAIYDGEYNNMKWSIEVYKLDEKRMPKNILPIASDGLGNEICISCGGIDLGYVYFWDHEKEVDYDESDDSNYSNLYLIAKSFNEFIDGLYEDDEEEYLL